MSTFSPLEQKVVDLLHTIPGVQVMTGVACRAVKPCGPEVHNLHMQECYGMLLRQKGPHSWEK